MILNESERTYDISTQISSAEEVFMYEYIEYMYSVQYTEYRKKSIHDNMYDMTGKFLYIQYIHT